MDWAGAGCAAMLREAIWLDVVKDRIGIGAMG